MPFSNDQLAALFDNSTFAWTTNIAQVKAHLINCKAKCVQCTTIHVDNACTRCET